MASACFSVPGAEPPVFPEFKPSSARDYLTAVGGMVPVQAGTETETSFILARLRSQLGDKVEAERLARRALAGDPDRADIQGFLVGLLIHQDRMNEAADTLRKSLERKPTLPGASRQLGMVLDRLGDRKGARAAFEAAIRQAPKDATAELLLGRLLLDQGQAEEAARHLRKACQIDPQLGGAFYVLAEAQSRLGDPVGAQVSRERFQELKGKETVELDASHLDYDDERTMRLVAANFHAETATLGLKQKQPAVAEAHLAQAIRIAPEEPRAHELLGALFLQTGRLPEARTEYETLVRLQPQQAAYRVNLGTLLLQLREIPAGIEQLKQGLALDPQQPEALNNLARAYLGRRQDLPEALALSRRLAELRPTAASFDLLGWASYANGQTNEARTAAARAVELDPANAVYRERLRKLTPQP